MFFFGSGSAILPYVFYLLLIWGLFFVNGLVHHSLKYQKNKGIATGVLHEASMTNAKDDAFYYSGNSAKKPVKNAIHPQKDYYITVLVPLPENGFNDSGGYGYCLQGSVSLRAPPL
ncbi:MAG: hypothetical protein R6W78_07005 [Bacteroidales bacterium]